jgi:cobyrinic acid a,c-diamide synthase
MIAFLVGGTASGVGKTTAAVALMAAFRKRGLAVQPFKCGPDFIDGGYHSAVCGRQSRNLDTWMLGRSVNRSIFASASADADIAIVEGMMGLFDGATGDGDEGSSAEIAKLLDLPVLLVLDASKSSRSIAAMVKGFETFDGGLRFAGILLNGVAGASHYRLLKEAVQSTSTIRLLGWLPWDAEVSLPERYLGLHTPAEQNDSRHFFDRLALLAERNLDLDRLATLKHGDVSERLAARAFSDFTARNQVRIGIARDRAFSFYYEDNLDLLSDHGAELVEFSPLSDSDLPSGLAGIYLGGGYPELYAEQLSANARMLENIRSHAASGFPMYAECGGMMFLAASLTTIDGTTFPMASILPLRAAMTKELVHFGYAEVEFSEDCLLGSKGTKARGHSFHCSRVEIISDLRTMYRVNYLLSSKAESEGYSAMNVLASYIHLPFVSNPALAAAFVERARVARRSVQVTL